MEISRRQFHIGLIAGRAAWVGDTAPEVTGIEEATQGVCIEEGERKMRWEPRESSVSKGRFREQGRMEKGTSKSQEDP